MVADSKTSEILYERITIERKYMNYRITHETPEDIRCISCCCQLYKQITLFSKTYENKDSKEHELCRKLELFPASPFFLYYSITILERLFEYGGGYSQ